MTRLKNIVGRRLPFGLAFRWNDTTIGLALAVLGCLSRLPFATLYLYSWDSVNFALGMRGLNVTLHAPHPPGYPYYVGLARLLDLLLGNANASLVAISILFTGLTAAALFLLGRDLLGRETGIIASLSLLACVTFWSYGTIALSYTVLAFFSIAVAWAAARVALAGERRWLPWLTALYSIAGGFRPDLLLFLAPLWLWGLLHASWRARIWHGLAALVGFLVWFAPTAWLSGGPADYLAVFLAYLNRDVLDRYSVSHQGLAALGINLRDLASYFFYALYAQAALLAVAAAWLIWSGRWRREPVWAFLAVWIAPMVAFYIFVHIGDPGYVFAVLPVLCLLIAGWFAAMLRRPHRRIVAPALAIALIINAGIFLVVDKPLTAAGIRRNDVAIGAKMNHIRRAYRPEDVVLLSYASYKHTRYYLPDYPHTLWVDLFTRQHRRHPLPPAARDLVLVDHELHRLVRDRARWDAVDVTPGVRIYRARIQRETHVAYGVAGIEGE